MERYFRVGTSFFVSAALAVTFARGFGHTWEAEQQPPGPDRYAVVSQDYISYQWWLSAREDDSTACTLLVEHVGTPSANEIYAQCGDKLYAAWSSTQPCPQSEAEPEVCSGYYLRLVDSMPASRQVGVELPPPTVWVTLEGCIPQNSTFFCDSLPTLLLTAEEPLTEEHITAIEGRIDGQAFSCDPICQVDLAPTDEEGIDLEFWAYSSYGDSSEAFNARVRVVRSEETQTHSWYVDVISDRWRGVPLAGCSLIWDVFPSVGGVPDWLSAPSRPEDLATDVPYEYLAAHLIKYGVADAANCGDGGLSDSGLASACGLRAARSEVTVWQNKFDDLIYAAWQETGVSAYLLKSIFARESQFWPGSVLGHPESGLGQLTDAGADALLMWNPAFYEQFCPSVLDAGICKSRIYPTPEAKWKAVGLEDAERSLLRGALVQSVDSICPECPLGIDIDKANHSVNVFAQVLVANCEQAARVVQLNYDGKLDDVTTYEDLWRLTLVNYNAGPGCLGLAVNETDKAGESLEWENVSSHLTPACQGALEYVAAISQSVP